MSDTNFNFTPLFILGFDTDTTCHKSTKPKIHQWSEMYFQTTGGNALLTCRSAGPHEIFWIGPNGKPVDIKGKKYQVRDLVAMRHFKILQVGYHLILLNTPLHLQMTSQGDLIVRNLSFEDMGNFQCLVKNIHGSDMIETFVYPLATES